MIHHRFPNSILNVSFTPKREVFCETNDVLRNEAVIETKIKM